MNRIFYDEFDSAVGIIRVAVNAQGELLQVALKNATQQPDDRDGRCDHCNRDSCGDHSDRGVRGTSNSALTSPVRNQITEYLSGKRKSFSLPLKPEGTSFQKSVWNELLKIPYGTTTTYASIATAIGNPKACRAVGRAVGANPIFIIVPCHRVIGSSGKLTGFAYGLDVKRTLLDREGSL